MTTAKYAIYLSATLALFVLVAAIGFIPGIRGNGYWYGAFLRKDAKKDCDQTKYYFYGVDTNKCKENASFCSDGYYFPLFKSAADAETEDKCLGGSGKAHEHQFENCNDTFYMPDSSMQHGTLYKPNEGEELKCTSSAEYNLLDGRHWLKKNY